MDKMCFLANSNFFFLQKKLRKYLRCGLLGIRFYLRLKKTPHAALSYLSTTYALPDCGKLSFYDSSSNLSLEIWTLLRADIKAFHRFINKLRSMWFFSPSHRSFPITSSFPYLLYYHYPLSFRTHYNGSI